MVKRILLYKLRHLDRINPNLNLLYEASLYAYDNKTDDKDFYDYVNAIIQEYRGIIPSRVRRYKFSDKVIKRLRYGSKRKYYTKEYRSLKNRVTVITLVTLVVMLLVSYVIFLSFSSSKVAGTLLADMTLVWMLFSVLYSSSIDARGQKYVVYSPYVGKNVADMGRIWNNILGVSEIVDVSFTKDIPDQINQLLTLELQRRKLYLS